MRRNLRVAAIAEWFLAISAVLMVAAVYTRLGRSRTSDILLPQWGVVPAFRLTAQDGRQVSSEDLRGRIWVANFFFTRCAGISPIMQAHMQRLYEAYTSDPNVRLVSFTVDPEHDTVRHYAAMHRSEVFRQIGGGS